MTISDIGFKVYLNIPADITEATTFVNPGNVSNDENCIHETGYLSLFAAGGQITTDPNDPTIAIDAYEATTTTYRAGQLYRHLVNKDRIILRDRNGNADTANYQFSCLNSSYNDLIFADCRTALLSNGLVADVVNIYNPRSSHYGQWNNFYNQMVPLDPNIPNCLSIGMGKNGDTDRVFTWQSPSWINRSYLLYRNVNSAPDAWIRVPRLSSPSLYRIAMSMSIPQRFAIWSLEHTPIRSGSEGRWGDVHSSRSKLSLRLTPSRFSGHRPTKLGLLGNDRRGAKPMTISWPTRLMIGSLTPEISHKTPTDHSNGVRTSTSPSRNLSSNVHMTIVGNNDLIANEAGVKGDPTAFTYYSTVERAYQLPATTTQGSADLTNITNATKIVAIGRQRERTRHPQRSNCWGRVWHDRVDGRQRGPQSRRRLVRPI